MIVRQSGFSSMEMLIVVAVIGVLTVLSISFFGTQSRVAGFRSDTLQLESFLNRARDMAIAQNRCVAVWIDEGSASYAIYSGTNCLPAPPSTSATSRYQSSHRLAPFDTGNPLIFSPEGGTLTQVPARMTVAGEENELATVTVAPLIGQVKVEGI